MHEITSHKINECNEAIAIHASDLPGSGGANHEYRLASENFCYELKFQNGPILEVGVNGLTHEALLAVIEDRLVAFQSGPYACRENAVALTKLQEARMWLQERTRGRVNRGVEGTHKI